MEFEKIEGSRKGFFIYCANGYIYTKNNEYKGKINLRCHSYKKGCCGTVAVENGNFFENQPHTCQKSRWNPKDQNLYYVVLRYRRMLGHVSSHVQKTIILRASLPKNTEWMGLTSDAPQCKMFQGRLPTWLSIFCIHFRFIFQIGFWLP